MITSLDWQSLSLQLVTTFAHFLWQGALIGALLAILLRVCSSRFASTRYVFASVAFALLPLCAGATFAIVHRGGDPIYIGQASPATVSPTLVHPTGSVDFSSPEFVAAERESGPVTQLPIVQVAEAAAPVVAVKSWSSWLPAASRYLIVVYLIGVAVSLLRLGSSVWASGRLRRAVKKIEDAAITRIIAEQATRMGLKRIPLFALCDQISVPVVAGILKPTILLPPAILCGLDPQQLAAILSHEMAHIRRYDLLVNLMQRVVEALLFFHPVTWWISRRMSAEREDCCDDLAIAGCGRLEFAGALLRMAELCAKQRGLAVGPQLEAMAADGGNESQLARRVHRLLGDGDSPRLVLSRSAVVMAVVATFMLTIAVCAFAQTEANRNDKSRNQMPASDETRFARLPVQYTHLVYDQSVLFAPSRGLQSTRVVQPLPASGKAVQSAIPIAQHPLSVEALHRIGNAYPTFRPDESIVVKDNSVLLRNTSNESEQVLARGISRASNFTRILARVAISPNRKRVAAAVLIGSDDGSRGSVPLFDIYVIDVSSAKAPSKLIRTGVIGDAIMGGAALPAAVAPPIFWSDNENLLLVIPKPRPDGSAVAWVDIDPGSEPTAAEFGELGSVLIVRDGEVLTPTHDLLRVDLGANSTQHICDLKLGTFIGGQQTSTDFWRRSDGAIMLRSRGTDSRIDFAQSIATTDRKLSPQYELRGDQFNPSLWYGDEQLAEVVHFHNVGVSPDGRSIAWYTRSNPRDTSNLGNTSQYPTTLWFHSPDSGAVKLAEGKFAWSNHGDVFDNPIVNPRFHWLTPADFVAKANATDKVTEEPHADADDANSAIAWGEPTKGLRVGLMLSGGTDNAAKRFRHGDLATAQLFVQNVDSKPLKCQVLLPHPMDGWGLNIRNSDGDSILPNTSFISSIRPLRIFQAELAPNEIQPITGKLPKFREGNELEGYIPEVTHAAFEIEAKTPEQGQYTPPFTYGLPNGTYTASSFVTLRRADPPAADISLSTAAIAFQVGGKSDDHLAGELSRVKPNETSETTTLANTLPQLPDTATDTNIDATNANEKPRHVETPEDLLGPSHYHGTVVGPDGKPLEGAEVFVISTWNQTTKLGPVRDLSDAEGKFAFDAADMTWQALGITRRRGGLIVAKQPGFVPEWMETWGDSRGVFSTGLWGQTRNQTLELQLTRDDVPIRGRLLDVDGKPLANARVRLTRIMVPRNRDLTAFLDHWSKAHSSAAAFTGIPYKREINKHFELMDLDSERVSDAHGRFELSGIGRDRIVQLEITAPDIVTTSIQVMTRDTENVGILLDGFDGTGKPTQTIYGANFAVNLAAGLTVTGVVRDRDTQQPVAGMWVTNRGYSPLTAPQFTKDAVVTDSNGRFTLRGLNPKLLEYEKESTRSISAIPQPGVQYLRAGTVFEKNTDTVIETLRGIGYRLKVVNEDGQPVKANVEYRQIHPNSVGSEMVGSVGGGASGDINHAARRGDGTYEGFVLPGPGAVLVSVPGSEYRPASVDPKNFFEPGKTWNEDSTYSYGTDNILALRGSWLDQRRYEAIVLVNPARDSEPLNLTATIIRDQPRTISLVDAAGNPVADAVARLHERRGTSAVSETISGASFKLDGLNVDKDQWITFLHPERKLATVVAIRGDSNAGVTVKLQPWGTVKGRFVDENGEPVVITGKSDFSTIVRNAAHGAKEYFAHTVGKDGRFQIEGFAAGQSYSTSGTYRNRKNYVAEGLFHNLVLGPGEIRDLGDIVVHTPDARR
nr:hypothetical protein [uncultured bacterium]